MNIIINPEFERLIPPLSADEAVQLEALLVAEGIRDALVIARYPNEDGEEIQHLADGHNRLRIAQKHGLDYRTEIKDFPGEDDVVIWMIDNQKGRRNLTDFVKLELAEVKAERLRKKGKKTQGIRTDLLSTMDKKLEAAPHNTRNEIAADLGWGTGKVARGKVVMKEATEALKAKVRTGEVSINQAYQSIRKEQKIEEVRQAVKELQSPKVCAYGDNMFYQSAEQSEVRYGDKVFSMDDAKYNTVSTLSRFFHKETGIEFTLREYANVQTFPNYYKFIGTYSTIKKQIGNAVAPYMGAYITSFIKGKTVGDLFAGCGGFSAGAHENGLETKWAVEWDESAARSFKLNFPLVKVYQTDIKALDPLQFNPVDVIIGGPPCQGFSSANHENKKVMPDQRFADDPRNELYKEFLRFVLHLKPPHFIMENVPEIRDVEDEIIADFEAIGYSIETKLVTGNEIGMKQNRKRFFFIGTKID